MKKFALALSFLSLPFALAPALTSCNTEPDYIKQQRKVEEEQKKNDDVLIQGYLTRNNIKTYNRLPSGVYVLPVTEGNPNDPLIKAGNKVTTNYVVKYIIETIQGQTLTSSSVNHSACGCYSFFANQATTDAPIGLQEAILTMRKGDRKQVIIPSPLLGTGTNLTSYYQNAAPYNPLLFDIEILDVQQQ
ncbi:FKBP-type peptidyl-prolyl cis-trans isomerase [Hymenobacter sediminis]|uniref:FKBP-type peptidyl-prolyl cis-trans isomerase n=1 Tax=Hymenobacter sediminis TaxID=2218621 RepID=UPI00139065CB|nr:FKBP-type peptidyl-prolyl cis-trans isomerase [Hymenobacter sediminis]